MVDAFKRQRSAGYETKLLAEDISPQDIFAAAEAHSDPLSVKVIVDAAEALGYGIRGLNNLLDLELIVLGGGIPLAAPPYFLTHIESSAMGGVNRVNLRMSHYSVQAVSWFNHHGGCKFSEAFQ